VDDLAEFLAARLDESEVRLRAVNSAIEVAPAWPSIDHLLADLEGKRAIMRMHRPLWPDDGDPLCGICGDPSMELLRGSWPCATLRVLVQPWADDPTFDPRWSLPGGLEPPRWL
jgi:Family of unknown function (DUF6221)